MSEVAGWFVGRLPDGWFTAAPTVLADREEIVVIGPLACPDVEGGDDAKAAPRTARAKRFREETRQTRMAIAEEAGHRFGRKGAWGGEIDGERYLVPPLG